MPDKLKRALLSGWPLAFGLALVLLLFVHQGTLLRAGDSSTDELSTVAQVRDLIVDNWVEDPSSRRDRMRYGAVEGMASQLDPYSAFIPPERKQRFDEDLEGEFGGLGILMEIDKGQVVVLTPLEDTPAWQAGLLPDDRVLEIDGKKYEFNSRDEATKHLRGKVGSKVSLLVSNPRRKKDELVTLERAAIKVQSVRGARILGAEAMPVVSDTAALPRVGYLDIAGFQGPTEGELDKAIADLTSAGMAALVVDLRGNPGGLLNQAIEMAGRWLEKGDLVVTTRGRGRKNEQKTYADEPADAPRIRVPTAILLDGDSASASEVLSGALRDHKRAVLVGTRSLGKGSVQSIFPIDNGKAKLKLTTQYWYTPNDRLIHRTEKATEKDPWGLLPDINVPIDQQVRGDWLRQEGDLEVDALRRKRDPQAPPFTRANAKIVRDPQLDAAVTHLIDVVAKKAPLVPDGK